MTGRESLDLAAAEENPLVSSRVLPLVTPETAREMYNAHLGVCQAILVPYDERIIDEDGVVRQESDYARIPQRKQADGRWVTEYVDFPKKSAWRKMARFYGLSTEIVGKERLKEKDGSFTWHYTVRAWIGGFTTMGEGACNSAEARKERTEHETKSTAHTRAMSRAISDLIGFGQVSAEEIIPEEPRKTVPSESNVKEPRDTRQATSRQRQALHRFGVKTIPENLSLTEASEIMNKLVSLSEAKNSEDIKEMVKKLNTEWVTERPDTEKKEKKTVEDPELDPAVENVVQTLLVNGLRVADYLEVFRQDDKVYVKTPRDIDQDTWNSYNAILGRMKADWNSEARRWEVPVK